MVSPRYTGEYSYEETDFYKLKANIHDANGDELPKPTGYESTIITSQYSATDKFRFSISIEDATVYARFLEAGFMNFMNPNENEILDMMSGKYENSTQGSPDFSCQLSPLICTLVNQPTMILDPATFQLVHSVSGEAYGKACTMDRICYIDTKGSTEQIKFNANSIEDLSLSNLEKLFLKAEVKTDQNKAWIDIQL